MSYKKKRNFAYERRLVIQEEVEKLLQVGILGEVKYRTWIANPVMVKKVDGG